LQERVVWLELLLEKNRTEQAASRRGVGAQESIPTSASLFAQTHKTADIPVSVGETERRTPFVTVLRDAEVIFKHSHKLWPALK
jgi:hypothetical protein